jgi:pyochelin biosynthetic protein PchC
MSTSRQSWLRQLRGEQSPKTRLVCFPHSGGSVNCYAAWAAAMGPGVQLLGVQYPGRADRLDAPPVSRVREMATRVAAGLSELEPLPLALFGHSLGALVCYETALELLPMGLAPSCLMVSGSPPPGHASGGQVHLAADKELWNVVCRMGGIEPEVADSDEFASLLLPALRADITASETYQPRPHTAQLSCPVRCHYGTSDHFLDASLLPAWATVTRGDFMLLGHPGGHFQVYADASGILNEVRDVMTLIGEQP